MFEPLVALLLGILIAVLIGWRLPIMAQWAGRWRLELVAVVVFTAALGLAARVSSPTTQVGVAPVVASTSTAATVTPTADIVAVQPEVATVSATSSASDTLITEPAAGVTPVLTKINEAQHSIDLVMYELEDTQVETALAAAAGRGVTVRVLLNGSYYGKPDQPNQNAAAYSYLQAHHVAAKWTPGYFALTHQKTLLVDGSDALIMTFNLTPQYYADSRDFAVDDRDRADVAAIAATFNADWQYKKQSAAVGDDLVWSPGSESTMLALIQNAHTSLNIYNEEMNDATVTAALASAATRGVDVKVDMTYQSSWKAAFKTLAAAGVQVRTYAAKAPLYIHAKMILADGTRAFVGSENFSPTSLSKNRELGLVITNRTILNELTKTFTADWQAARPF